MKKNYSAPQTELLTIKSELGFLTYSNGQGGANASAMIEDDDLFEDWD